MPSSWSFGSAKLLHFLRVKPMPKLKAQTATAHAQARRHGGRPCTDFFLDLSSQVKQTRSAGLRVWLVVFDSDLWVWG